MSKREIKRIISKSDGLELELLSIYPETDPIGLVQFSHGMCEHKERYIPFMEYLAKRGIACVINDHRGHGNSVRDDRDLGYFYKNGARALVDDLHQITDMMRSRWPGKKLVLFGHSMGSLAVRAYAGRFDREIDGLIVCGSPGENPAVDAGIALVRMQSVLFGPRYRSRLLYSMSVGTYERKHKKTGKAGVWLSASHTNAKEYDEDPLCGFRFTLNGYRALLQLLRAAYRLPRTNNPALPIRFYSGAEDPCAPDERGFRNAIEKMRAAGYTDVSGYMFDGLRHEILREDEKHIVFDRIYNEAIRAMLVQ